MTSQIIEQNLIDKHSKRLLTCFRVLCNCYDSKETYDEKVYNDSILFLYLILFVLFSEDLNFTADKRLYNFLTQQNNSNKAINTNISLNFKEIIHIQCKEISKNTFVIEEIIDFNKFIFSKEDISKIYEYLLKDEKGANIHFKDFNIEFLNYLYEMFLQFFITKTDKILIVSHKGSFETYKEKLGNELQLSFLDDIGQEIIQPNQWILQKGCKRKQCQGAFYTPPKIVEYMVSKALTKYKSLNNLKILDPACGCGSFLIHTFSFLKKNGINPKVIVNEILYAIDIEFLPVQITKMVLFLLSGEFPKNIFCTDSLLKEDLPIINNSFDLVIGNPPYLNIERIDKDKKDYYLKNFASAIRRFDLYIIFIEQAITTFLKDNGSFSFIIPDKILTQSYAKSIREMLLETCSIEEIVEIKHSNLFKGATVIPVIISCKKPKSSDNYFDIVQIKPTGTTSSKQNQEDYFKTFNFIFRLELDDSKKQIIEYIQSKSKPLSKACYISWGLQPGNTKKFIFNKSDKERYESSKNNPKIRKLIRGGNVAPFNINYTDDLVLYIIDGNDKLHRPAFPELFETEKIVIPEVSGSKGIIAALDKDNYYTNHSIINVIMKKDLLVVDKSILKARGIHLDITKANHEPDLWQVDKGSYTRNSIVYRTDRDSFIDIKYILGLTNSKLIRYYFNNFLTGELNVFPELVKRLPFFDISFEEDTYKFTKFENLNLINNINDFSPEKIHDLIVSLVIDIYEGLPENRLKNQKMIDEAVYCLYGLSEELIEKIESDFN